ncbi:unnamed protein product [Rotaria sp. Silwood2]|nr:unnamed protein product [Rotaria sp. Silwood2]
MAKASFMNEVYTELAITKNLATTDTSLCHDEEHVKLSTCGFYSPSDLKHADYVNLICAGLDGLVNCNRTLDRQSISVKNATLSMPTTGSKMSATLQAMHQKKENIGILGRLGIWHLPTITEFIPPQSVKLTQDIASIDHLLIIGHEIVQKPHEFRFQKYTCDIIIDKKNSVRLL